jgi:hypothetical protein
MSSTTNTPYMVKSMNSVILISDGAGTTIENGTITTNNFNATNFNTNNIQGILPTDNITLYTNSLGSIDLGSATTAIVNINANDTNILAANSLYMNSGTTSSILASTINLISNEIVVGGGQNIYQNDLSQDFTIGGNSTTRNFYLGNLTAPPQVPFTATTGFDVVNYDTCVALIGGGGTGQLYADDIYTFTPGAFTSLWSDNTAGISIGANSILNSAAQSMGINNGTLALGTISNRSADTFIATGESHSGNIYLGSGRNSTGDIYIASNNYIGSSGVTTSDVFIGGSSTATRFNGTVNIAAFLPAGGTNSLTIGSQSTVNTLRGSSLNLNSTNASNNVVTIGSSNTTTATHLGTALNINSTNGTSNNVNIGSAQTTATHFGTQININSGNGTANTVAVGSLVTTTLTDVAQTINVNSTNGNSNTVNIGSSTSTINLGSSTASVINSYPITPSSGITYNATLGTNIAGTIGQIIATSTLTNSAIGTTTYPTERVINYPTISITDNGVWMISCTVPYENTAIGVAYRALLNLIVDTTIVARTTNMTSINTNQGQVNNPYYNSLCTVVVITAAPKTIQPEGRYIFGSGTWRTGTSGFELRAVRIA